MDVLLETAGSDATTAFEDVGHSEDSREILQEYLIGILKDAKKYVPPKAVRVISQKPEKTEKPATNLSRLAVTGALGAVTTLLYVLNRKDPGVLNMRRVLGSAIPQEFSGYRLPGGGFANGFLAATLFLLRDWQRSGAPSGQNDEDRSWVYALSSAHQGPKSGPGRPSYG